MRMFMLCGVVAPCKFSLMITGSTTVASFTFTPILDPTQFHCVRYLGPPLKDNFDKSAAPFYLFKHEEGQFVSLLTFTWNETRTSEPQLIFPFWMKNLNLVNNLTGEVSFTRLVNENVQEFEGILRVEWFSNLKSTDPRFPFETVLPEILGSKRPLTRNGTVIPFIFEGTRYALKFTPEECDYEVFWFNFETGTLKFDTDYVKSVRNTFVDSWSEELKILKYQIENGSKDGSKEAFLLCGLSLPLQEQLLDFLEVDYKQVSLWNFIPEEHLSMEVDDDSESFKSTEFLFIREVEKISKNLITEILRQCKHSRIILTSASRSIESSDQLIQLERSVKRFNYQVINCNFPVLRDEEKMRIIAEGCELDEREVSEFKWIIKSMSYVDLLRVCKRFKVKADGLKRAISSVKETGSDGNNMNRMYCPLPSQGDFNFRFFGYKSVFEELKSLVKGPLMNPEAYDRFNLPKSSGFLLHGPPGCGKTAIVLSILTSDPFRNLFTVLHVPSASQLLSKYFGETEANIRGLFSMARERKPSIIFIDQIECLGRKRGLSDGNDGTATDRYLSTLLNEMDGITGNEGVTIIACANDIKMLDEALLRPGRLDRHFYLGFPDPEDRSDIIRGYLKNAEYDELEIVKITEGMNGAEIKSFCTAYV